MAPEDYEEEPFGVWPENWPAVELFLRLSTQWRISLSGETGLDYAALYPLLDRVASDPTEWEALFDDVRVLEAEALQQMRKKSRPPI